MSRLFSLKNAALAAVLACGFSFANTASACDLYAPRITYRPVTTWRIVEQPFTDYVTKYDHCGVAYTVPVVSYRTVRVPVTNLVKVVY